MVMTVMAMIFSPEKVSLDDLCADLAPYPTFRYRFRLAIGSFRQTHFILPLYSH